MEAGLLQTMLLGPQASPAYVASQCQSHLVARLFKPEIERLFDALIEEYRLSSIQSAVGTESCFYGIEIEVLLIDSMPS